MPGMWPEHNFTGIIATDECTGREIVLTENTSTDEDARMAQAVFDAIGPGEGGARRSRCASCCRPRMCPAPSSAARSCLKLKRHCKPRPWGCCRRRCSRTLMRCMYRISGAPGEQGEFQVMY